MGEPLIIWRPEQEPWRIEKVIYFNVQAVNIFM